MKIQKIIRVISCVLALSGCVSVESLKAQLESTNPNEVKEAEEQILCIAVNGRDKSGFVEVSDINERFEYINLIHKNSFLISIFEETGNWQLRTAIIERLDFSEPGLGKDILINHASLFTQGCSMEENEFHKEWTRWLDNREIKDLSGFPKKVVDSMTEHELTEALKASDGECRKTALVALLKRTKDVKVLSAIYNNDELSGEAHYHAAKALGCVAKSIKDRGLILKLLDACWNYEPILSLAQKKVLVRKLSKDDAEKYALKVISKVYKDEYVKSGGVDQLRVAAMIAAASKDKTFIKKVTLELGKRIAEARDYNRYGWNDACDNRIKNLIKELPKMDSELFQEFVAIDAKLWPYCIDFADSELAYNLLAGGKCNSEKMEAAFLKKVPSEKIDAKLYVGLKYDASKHDAIALMSDEKKNEIATLNEASYKEINAKAKSAAKEMFELDSFYLGMSYEDAKIVFAHHFPGVEIKEERDGEQKDADYVFYIDGQTNPFCFAKASDKKVYQFNFGKKLLKKWYQFDVQSDEDWARTYERVTKIDFRFKLIEKKNTVTMTNDKVWFRQDSYQYKNNAKGYRITYFGEEHNFTARDGIGGKMVKEFASRAFRYVRGDQGMLRIRVEED